MRKKFTILSTLMLLLGSLNSAVPVHANAAAGYWTIKEINSIALELYRYLGDCGERTSDTYASCRESNINYLKSQYGASVVDAMIGIHSKGLFLSAINPEAGTLRLFYDNSVGMNVTRRYITKIRLFWVEGPDSHTYNQIMEYAEQINNGTAPSDVHVVLALDSDELDGGVLKQNYEHRFVAQDQNLIANTNRTFYYVLSDDTGGTSTSRMSYSGCDFNANKECQARYVANGGNLYFMYAMTDPTPEDLERINQKNAIINAEAALAAANAAAATANTVAATADEALAQATMAAAEAANAFSVANSLAAETEAALMMMGDVSDEAIAATEAAIAAAEEARLTAAAAEAAMEAARNEAEAAHLAAANATAAATEAEAALADARAALAAAEATLETAREATAESQHETAAARQAALDALAAREEVVAAAATLVEKTEQIVVEANLAKEAMLLEAERLAAKAAEFEQIKLTEEARLAELATIIKNSKTQIESTKFEMSSALDDIKARADQILSSIDSKASAAVKTASEAAAAPVATISTPISGVGKKDEFPWWIVAVTVSGLAVLAWWFIPFGAIFKKKR